MFSKDQEEVLDAIENGIGPFFITGPAGSGKSFLINELRQDPNCVVTATTGMAAQLISGRTIHSFCSIHPVYGAVKSHRATDRVRECGMLIIDEISMASAELLEQIFERFDKAEWHPVLVVVGDFLQLPPVEGKFAYESPMWEAFEKLTLTTVHRQSEKNFLRALGDLRLGKVSDDVIELIKDRRVSALPKDCTQLFAYRSRAERMNLSRLAELGGNTYRSKWSIDKIKKKAKIDESRPRFPKEIVVKIGARVVMLNNDSSNRWVNGSTGFVSDVEKGAVEVELDSGKTVTVRKGLEEVFDENGEKIFTVHQYPMRLAWALTIHKAQGMSLDRVGIDLDGHFAPGMTYVAMSRCRFRDGLFLKGTLSEIKVENSALEICA
jgi:ATP-dependent exoDNAse (exonuclease V) alpha subunit